MTFYQAVSELVKLSEQAEQIAKRIEEKADRVCAELEQAQEALKRVAPEGYHWEDTDTEYGWSLVRNDDRLTEDESEVI